ncbi:MAG: AmmeMemoRadiSam system radical SAM enzyme [Clostridiaceae bacterium]|jgi:pyruvate formate lyase activating enzyme|nr:AmmeMemoRadiSam system radical SAM enzyme [Clostridiaceae bacterium]
MTSIKAQYYTKLDNGVVHCQLCPHNCHIRPDKKGICKVRANSDGELYAESYGQLSSLALDPIEKKPLYRFYPGSLILSTGSYGCNFSCSFCQNYSISMGKPETAFISPENLVYKAFRLKDSGNIGLAYTYNEPFISFEYVLDCCKLIKDRGLKNVLVTNGYVQEAPLLEMLPYIDAMNIDLKSFSPDFYKEICTGNVEIVKRTIETASKSCHIEITCLVIPGLNDSEEEIGDMARWLSSLSPDIPLHLSRFFPRHKMLDKEITPRATLEKAARIASRYLDHVYLGNI